MRLVLNKTIKIFNALLIITGGMIIAYFAYGGMNKLPIKQYLSVDKTNAVWEWRNVEKLADSAHDTARYLQQHQINTIYLDISGVLQDKSEVEKAQYESALQKYIIAMSNKNIRVFASGGDVTWSKPENRAIPLRIMQYVFDHNKNNEYKFSGIEYDIESYNQEDFEEGSFIRKGIIISELLDTVDVLATQFEQQLKNAPDPEMELGFAVPYWFDNQNNNIKSVTWKEKTGPAIFHIMDRLHTLQHSNIVVMSYRNAARGNNGTIALARTEIQYAQYKATNVKVIVGQEVSNVEPEKITFYEKSKTEMSQEIKWIEEQFGAIPNYGGIAVNDLESFQNLIE
jgi:hypothetical protein